MAGPLAAMRGEGTRRAPGGNLDNTLVSGQMYDGVSSDVGTFGDVVDDCVSGIAMDKCSAFIITSQQIPHQVFGTGNGAPAP